MRAERLRNGQVVMALYVLSFRFHLAYLILLKSARRIFKQ